MRTQNKRVALVCAGLAVVNVLFAAVAQAQDVSFEAAQNFAAGRYPASVAVGDFNDDGVLDLAVPLAGSDSALSGLVAVLLGNGDGSFQAARSFVTGRWPLSIAVGDFNGDGLQDLAVANLGSVDISVLLGNGDGTFQGAQTFWAESAPLSVVVGDFNGDGLPDLAVANLPSSHDVSVLINNTPR